MLKDKRRKVLITMDIIEIIVSVIAIMVFTICFKMISNPIRFLFLLLSFLMVVSLSKSLDQFEKRFEKRVVKYSNTKLDEKYLRKIHA